MTDNRGGVSRLKILASLTMALLLAVYIGAMLYRAAVLFASGGVVAALIALALTVLSLIAIWALYKEIQFGHRGTKLSQQLLLEGGLVDLQITADSSGRANKADAVSVLPQLADEVSADNESWRAHMRYGIVLRAAGNYVQARREIGLAISLYRSQR